MDELKHIIENVQGFYDKRAEEDTTLLKHPFVIMGPTGSQNKEELRIYAYGALVGRIEIKKDGLKCELLNKNYIKKHLIDLSGADERKTSEWLENDVTPKGKYINGPWCQEVIGSEDYLRLALEAAKHKFHKTKKDMVGDFVKKERYVQTQIIRKYMKSDNLWSVIDTETGITKDWVNDSKVIKKVKKPDFVVFDRERKEFGIIELKYLNDNTENLKEHYDLFYEVSQQPQVFIERLFYRMQVLAKYNLLKKEYENVDISHHIWFGFLFVGGGHEGAVKIIKSHLDEIQVSLDCRFLYVEDVDGLNKKGLKYDEMLSYEEFVQ